MTDTEKPVRTRRDDSNWDDYRETHPAYGMVGASRIQSNGTYLAGSDFRHQGLVEISIRKGDLSRAHNQDYWMGHDEVVSVQLSEAQWASFVSTMNVGNGVPCTIHFIGGEGYLPRIEPVDDRRQQFNAEVADEFREAVEAIEELRDTAKTKAQRDLAQRALMRLNDSLPWVARSFDKHAENTVEKAKAEVDAFVTGAIQRAGLAALTGGQPILTLGTGEGEVSDD